MSGESGQVTEVTQQEGKRVLLSVPMVGFPPGFKLRPGERVVLVQDEKGPAVRPLVYTVTVDDLSEESAGTLKAGRRNFAVQKSTVRDEGTSEEGGGGPYEVFVVDRGKAKGPEQVIAIRPVRVRRSR
jgi:hypothetical protein